MKICKQYKCVKAFSNKKYENNIAYCYENSEFAKIQLFTNIQMIRYGYYRRSDLKKDKVKKILSSFNPFFKNINSSDPIIISLKGLIKIFIGELVETSRQIMYERKDNVQWLDNAIQSKHIFESLDINLLDIF
nr:transcription initiation factor IID SU beta [Cryptomonas sp.]